MSSRNLLKSGCLRGTSFSGGAGITMFPQLAKSFESPHYCPVSWYPRPAKLYNQNGVCWSSEV